MFKSEHLTDALRFWEIARIPYNLALCVTVYLTIVLHGAWPPQIGPIGSAVSILIVLAAIANLLYCAAYPIDLIVQSTAFREARFWWRLALWCAGTLLAMSLAYLILAGAQGGGALA